MKAHLLVFDETLASRKEVQRALNQIEGIENWYSFFGNILLLATELEARQVSREVRTILPELRFIVTEATHGEVGGYLPSALWRFIREPQAVDAGTT